MKKNRVIKKITKANKEVTETIERNWKKIIIITLLTVLVLSSLLFITGLRIRFAFGDVLIVNLKPSEKSFNVANRQSQNITFLVSSENSRFCTASCNYVFYDRSNEELLHEGNMTLKRETIINKTYQINPPLYGSGQKIFNFDIQCVNLKSFLCSTTNYVKRKSSFITLNYQLTEKETQLKDELGNVVRDNMILLNNASSNLQKVNSLFATDFIEKEKYFNQYLNIKNSLDIPIKGTNNILDLWSKEYYLTIKESYLGEWINSSKKSSKLAFNLLDSAVDSVNGQINLTIDYNFYKGIFFNIGEMVFIINSSQITVDFYSLYDTIKTISENFGNYSSMAKFEGDVSIMSDLVVDLNKKVQTNYSLIMLEGKSLVDMEFAKKCNLGYCENITGDACLDIKKISLEYANSAYILPNDFIPSDDYIVNENDTKILISLNTTIYYDKYCNVNKIPPLFVPDIKQINPVDFNINITKPLINELTQNPPLCCVYGKCLPCCQNEECKNNPNLFPLILIHGHSLVRNKNAESSLDILNKIQYQLQDDGYINTGTIRFDFNPEEYIGDWGLSNSPVVVKASYYYDYFYSVGKYIYLTRNTDNLDTYAIRLKDIVDLIKSKTGKPKVNIIAHSMGGLVARRYIQIFGDSSVDKLILIGTPNLGIDDSVKKYCNLFGEKSECEDMYVDSVLMKKLNDPYYKPSEVRIYTISGKGCDMGGKSGDGVVVFENSLLSYATSYIIDGVCEDTFKVGLHNGLTDIDKYPLVYEDIREILEMG